MLVKLSFHPWSDLSNKDEIVECVLNEDELESVAWEDGHILSYRTEKDISEVVASWEDENFYMADFVKVEFEN